MENKKNVTIYLYTLKNNIMSCEVIECRETNLYYFANLRTQYFMDCKSRCDKDEIDLVKQRFGVLYYASLSSDAMTAIDAFDRYVMEKVMRYVGQQEECGETLSALHKYRTDILLEDNHVE